MIADFAVNFSKASRLIKNDRNQDDHAGPHDDTLHDIGPHHGPEPTVSGVEHDNHCKNNQSPEIGIVGEKLTQIKGFFNNQGPCLELSDQVGHGKENNGAGGKQAQESGVEAVT